MEKPIKEVLHDDIWPEEFRNDIDKRLEQSFHIASETLGSNLYPSGKKGFPYLEKNEFFKNSSTKLGKNFKINCVRK